MALLLLAAVGLISASTATVYAPIPPLLCDGMPGATTNYATRVPRLDFTGRTTRVDLGAYDVFSCPTNKSCTVDVAASFSGVMSAGVSGIAAALRAAPADSLLAYVEGLGSFTLINVFLAVFVPLVTALCICGRYCCCCFARKPDACLCLRCGAAHPTRATMCGCGCGVVELQGPAAAVVVVNSSSGEAKGPARGSKKSKREKKDGRRGEDLNATMSGRIPDVEVAVPTAGKKAPFGYPVYARACAVLALALWVALGGWMIASAHFSGNVALTRSLLALGDDAMGAGLGHSFVGLIRSFVGPVEEVAVGVSADVFLPLLLSLNASFAVGFPLPTLRTGLVCVNTTLSPASLPDFGVATAFLASLQASLDGVTADVRGIRGQLGSITAVESYVTGNASLLSISLGYVQLNFSAIGTAITLTSAGLTNMTIFQTAVVAELNPVASTLSSLSSTYPATAAFNAVAGASDPTVVGSGQPTYPTLNDLISGGLTSNSAQTAALATKLANMRTSIAAVPDTASTATALDNVNALVNLGRGPYGPLAALNGSLTALGAAVAALPRSASLTDSLTGITDTALRVPGILASLKASLLSIQVRIRGVPSVGPLLAQLDRVRPLIDTALGCVPTFTALVTSLNTSLVSLPSFVQPYVDMLNVTQLNETASSMLSPLDTIRSSILAANASLQNAVDVGTYVAQVDAADASVSAQLATLDIPSLLTSLGSLDAQTSGLDLSSARSAVANAASALATATVNPQYASDMRNFSTVRGWLLGNLTATAADVTLLSQGYCSTTFTGCTSSATCAPDSCLSIAVGRCYAGTGGAEQGTACSLDSACTSPARCLGDVLRLGAVKGMLNNAGGALPSLSTATAAVASAQAGAVAGDTSAATAALASASSAMAAINVASYQATLTSLSSSLASSFDSTGVNAALDSALSSISSTNTSTYTGQVDDARTMFDSLAGPDSAIMKALRSGIEGVDALQAWLTVTAWGPLNRMRRPALTAVRTAGGPTALARALTAAIDDLAASAIAALQPLSSFFSPPAAPNTTALLQPYFPYGDRATGRGEYADNSAHGPLYFLLSVAAPDMIVPSSDLRTVSGSVLADSLGYAYGGGKMCVTGSCIRQTVKAISTEPLSGLAAALPILGGRGLPLPLSREQVLLVPWVFPALAILLGLWGLLAPLLCCCRSPLWHKAPTSCMIGVTICQLPLLLLLTAAAFPLFLGLSDVCATGQNVGYKYVIDSGDALCTSIPGAMGTAAACGASMSTSFDLPGAAPVTFSVDAKVNLPATAAALLGDCPAVGSAADPFAPAFASIASSVGSAPYKAITAVLSGTTLSSSGITLRAGLTTPLLAAGNATGAVLATLVTSLGAEALTCGSLSGIIDEIRGLLCCTFVQPLAWYVGMFYAIGWVMVVLALPAGICGRKRIPVKAWGPSVASAQGEEYLDTCCCGLCTRGKPVPPAALAENSSIASSEDGAWGPGPSPSPSPRSPAHELESETVIDDAPGRPSTGVILHQRGAYDGTSAVDEAEFSRLAFGAVRPLPLGMHGRAAAASSTASASSAAYAAALGSRTVGSPGGYPVAQPSSTVVLRLPASPARSSAAYAPLPVAASAASPLSPSGNQRVPVPGAAASDSFFTAQNPMPRRGSKAKTNRVSAPPLPVTPTRDSKHGVPGMYM